MRAGGGGLSLVNVQDAAYEVFDVTCLVHPLDVRRGPGDFIGPAVAPPLAS